ncbi:serine hydrolase domain-containing protein [Streptosporangium canum]|uniref:serine hydrolase domain-containing protein n=1 Tax=Streptosporangium canum TaxID=324952 RepID=UPI0033B9C8F7
MKIGHVAAVACLTVALSATPAGAATGSRADTQAALDEIVEGGSVSAVAEVRNGTEVWRGGSGTVTVHGGGPAPVRGRFRAGSTTKSFIATVILQLAGEGRLSLDDEVERLLPGLVEDGGEITVGRLLQHTSGLADYTTGLFDGDGVPRWRYRTWSPEELVRRADGLPRGFPPGAGFAYSNTNYVVLGMIIEKVTGRPYATEIERRILRPLGLRDTLLPGASPEVPGPHAHAYVAVRRGGRVVPVDVTNFNPTMAGAAGELVSTTGDLNRFYGALLGGRLLGPAMLRRMKDPGTTGGYGLGLEVAPLSCGTAYGHGGGGPEYLVISFTSADGNRQVTVSTKPYSGDPGPRLRALLETALCP